MPKRPRTSLGRFVGRGKEALLEGYGVLSPGTAKPPSGDIHDELDKAELRLEGDPSLWEREWAAISVRSALRSLDDLSDADAIRARCDKLLERMRVLDHAEFDELNAKMKSGEYGPEDYVAELERRPFFERGPFTQRLFGLNEVPDAIREREPDMVHFLGSPIQVVFDFMEMITEDDVLYDLGSGLGIVPMMAAWLGPARTVGVEYEPKYAEMAQERVEALNITRATIICADARDVEYDDGTIFYFYEPFRGKVLDAVFEKLKKVSLDHPIRVCFRGPHPEQYYAQDWLEEDRVTASGIIIFNSTTHRD